MEENEITAEELRKRIGAKDPHREVEKGEEGNISCAAFIARYTQYLLDEGADADYIKEAVVKRYEDIFPKAIDELVQMLIRNGEELPF